MTSLNGTVQCVQIGIENDTVIEDDEQFEVSLVLPDSDDVDGGSPLVVTIEDNDGRSSRLLRLSCVFGIYYSPLQVLLCSSLRVLWWLVKTQL